MLNPTLSDLIGGIQTVTLGDEEARRRRTQKSVLERKAPPTFDVVVEIHDRDRVAVHTDVAETVDALLRGDALAPELRWRDEGGVHRTQARPRPGPRSGMPGERFGGLVGGGLGGWGVEPGWRPEPRRSSAVAGLTDLGRSGAVPRGRGRTRGRADAEPWLPEPRRPETGVFRSGALADRGPLERGTPPPPEPRARDSREHERQAEWRASADRALDEVLVAQVGTLDPVRARRRGAPWRSHRERTRQTDASPAAGELRRLHRPLARRGGLAHPAGRPRARHRDPGAPQRARLRDQPQAAGAGHP